MTLTDETYTLTDPGWPRPRIDGYPIPWVAPAEKLSEVNEGRRLASVGGGVCQVCGLSFPFGANAFGFICTTGLDALETLEWGDYLSSVLDDSAIRISFLDGALLHLDCARLTAVACPHIKNRTDLICVRVPANDADPAEDAEGILRPTYPAGDCMYVPWPVQR